MQKGGFWFYPLILGLDLLPVIDQMQVHRIVSANSIMSCNRVCNLTVRLDYFVVQSVAGTFYEKWNRVENNGNQPWNNDIFAAQCNGCMQFNVFGRVIFMGEPVKKSL